MTATEFQTAKARVEKFAALAKYDAELEALQKHLAAHTNPDVHPDRLPGGISVVVDGVNADGGPFGRAGDSLRAGLERSFPDDLIPFVIANNLQILLPMLQAVIEARAAVAVRRAGL